MRRDGIDPGDSRQRRGFSQATLKRFKEDLNRAIRGKNRDCTIFYNSGHIDWRSRCVMDTVTHFELESLPSGDWGYDHLPITGRFCRRAGRLSVRAHQACITRPETLLCRSRSPLTVTHR